MSGPPIWHPPDGRSTYETVSYEASQLGAEHVAALAARSDRELRRLAPIVDELVGRATVPDQVWAIEQRIERLEQRDSDRSWGAIAMLVVLVGWSGLMTAITVVLMLAG